MTNIYGYNNRDIHMLHADEYEPNLNEQEAVRLQRTKPHMPLVNAVVASLLRSPLHGLLSSSVMLLSIVGQTSGRTISTPVNYIEDENSTLYVLSERNRTWWRNLNAGAHVTLWLRGEERGGFAKSIRNPNAVAAELARLLPHARGLAGLLHMRWNEDGTPNSADLLRVARDHVVVRIHLS
jgi:hypothetical protein